MTRPVRVNVAGGWYHIYARGHNRESIFADDGDREHFVELPAEMGERFRVRVYAYSLLGNHYHLLVGTPAGNVSRAVQWLNSGYSVWHNRRHGRTGHVFDGRFHAALVEGSGWGLEVSVYIHLNPVAVKALGWGKRERRAEREGVSRPPSPAEVERRLQQLREFRWSSYRGYAGYGKLADWVAAGAVLGRVKGSTAGYRDLVEDRIRQGVREDLWAKVRWGVVLGSERFARKVRGRIRVRRESQGRRELRAVRGLEDLVQRVERIKGERWERFRDRHGDWGRDLVIGAARRYSGLTLAQIGERVGGMDYTAVCMAAKRLECKAATVGALRAALKRLRNECE